MESRRVFLRGSFVVWVSLLVDNTVATRPNDLNPIFNQLVQCGGTKRGVLCCSVCDVCLVQYQRSFQMMLPMRWLRLRWWWWWWWWWWCVQVVVLQKLIVLRPPKMMQVPLCVCVSGFEGWVTSAVFHVDWCMDVSKRSHQIEWVPTRTMRSQLWDLNLESCFLPSQWSNPQRLIHHSWAIKSYPSLEWSPKRGVF